jgi:hypothetical protein
MPQPDPNWIKSYWNCRSTSRTTYNESTGLAYNETEGYNITTDPLIKCSAKYNHASK